MATRDPNRVIIFDTTLRDGEQSPGCSMNLAEKLRDRARARGPRRRRHRGRLPDRLAAATSRRCRRSPGEVAGPGHRRPGPLQPRRTSTAPEAAEGRARPRIHVFLATSAIHREFKLKMAKEEIVRAGRRGREAGHARCCEDVEFSPEDAARTELDFLGRGRRGGHRGRRDDGQHPRHRRLRRARAVRRRSSATCKQERRAASTRSCFSVHCHNDLGLAVANSLAAVRAGARQVECTINGIGERAGNCALEEVVMALRTRDGLLRARRPASTRDGCYPTSRLVSHVTGHARAAQQGDRRRRTPSPTRPASTRTACSSTARPTRSCGPRTSACRADGAGAGQALRPARPARARPATWAITWTTSSSTARLRGVQGAGRQEEGDLRRRHRGAGAAIRQRGRDGPWKLERLHVESGSASAGSAASCSLRHADGRQRRGAAPGDGPVDAVFKAIERRPAST